ncbi:hypothetical protein ACRAKG_33165 [Streptomyces rosealbus]
MPDVKSYDLEMVNMHGMWPGTDWMRGRTLTLSVRVLANDHDHLAQLMGELTSAFSYGGAEEYLRFKIPGVAQGASARVRGRVRRRAVTIDGKYATSLSPLVDVEFACTDPWIEATSVNERSMEASVYDKGGISLIEPGSVFDFPLSTGLVFPNNAGMSPAKPAVVTNGSMDNSPITAEIYGPVMNGVFFEARIGSASSDSMLVHSEKVADGVGIDNWYGRPFRMEFGDKLVLDSQLKRAKLTSRTLTGGLEQDITSQLTRADWFEAKAGATIQCYLTVPDPGGPQFYAAETPKPTGTVFWKLSKFI